ncbi:MAG: 4Fe-4S binding protein, partial [Spirochaetota bacterium]
IFTLALSSIRVDKSDTGLLRVSGEDFDPVEVEMVVLATGITPQHGIRELAEMLHADLDEYGFFKPDHAQLHTTGSVIDGVYVAGCASMPASVSASVTQAQAVAGDILSKLVPGREIELEVMTACIDENRCAGCKLCLVSCPFKAISFDHAKKVSTVNEAICHGCGTCAANCPSSAAVAKHFTDEQLYAEIGGILHA